MIWFMERETDLLICEIRRSSESAEYEFELAPSSGRPETRSFSSATDLIDQYLLQQSTLQAQGWRPRLSASAEC
jgi:hypothetical protein